MKTRILSAIMILVMMMCSMQTVWGYDGSDDYRDEWIEEKNYKRWIEQGNGKRYVENGIAIEINYEKGIAEIVGIMYLYKGDIVVPKTFKGLPTEMKIKMIPTIYSKNVTLANIKEFRTHFFNGCVDVENIFIPKTVKKSTGLNGFNHELLQKIKSGERKKVNIYYEGSEEDLKKVENGLGLFEGYYVIYYNCTGIGKSSNSQEQSKGVAYDFTINPKSGYRKDANYEGTDFTITVTTSKDVKKISFKGDKDDGTWHEITYDDLKKLYNLTYKDSGDKRIWTCSKFKIYNAGKERKLKLYTDGTNSGKEVKVEVFAKNVSTSDKIKPDVYSFQCDSKANINRKDVTKIKFKAAAKDNIKVTKIKIILNGVEISREYGSTVSATVLTSGLNTGKNELYAMAYDDAGNIDYSSPIYITVTDGSFSPTPQQNSTSVSVNGKYVNFDVSPQIINGRTMIPVRAVAEAFGATVTWNAEKKEVRINGRNEKKKIERDCRLQIGSASMYWEDAGAWLNGGYFDLVELDSPATIIDGRTLVPIRAIAEVFGYTVDWDETTKTVKINS